MTTPVRKYMIGRHIVQEFIDGGKSTIQLDFRHTTLTWDEAREWAYETAKEEANPL